MPEPELLADVLEPVIDLIGNMELHPERHDVTRVGERQPIQPIVRALVHQRDGNRCQACGQPSYPGSPNPLQLDHIIPWSAGGTDQSDNLRSLCAYCNENRSNWRGPLDTARRPVGVTPICVPCAAAKYGDLTAARQVPEELQTPVYCGACHMTSWTHLGDVL